MKEFVVKSETWVKQEDDRTIFLDKDGKGDKISVYDKNNKLIIKKRIKNNNI